MRYFVVILIVGLWCWLLSLPVYAKNEYLGGNWRNCESGHIEPYVEKTERDIDYLDNNDSRDDDELRYGVRFRFKLGNTCNKKFRKQQEERYELEQQIELLKICRKYKSIEMGPELELVAKKCRDMKFLKKEDKRKRTDDDLFNEIMKLEHKKQMELKDNGPIKK
jgi:hypothetical protein